MKLLNIHGTIVGDINKRMDEFDERGSKEAPIRYRNRRDGEWSRVVPKAHRCQNSRGEEPSLMHIKEIHTLNVKASITTNRCKALEINTGDK